MVILFLISVALIGAGIDFLIKHNSQPEVITYLSQVDDMGKINLNQADRDTLKGVTGVGERLAGRIIEYRSRNSGFKDIKELQNIKGIGTAKYNTIIEYFTVE